MQKNVILPCFRPIFFERYKISVKFSLKTLRSGDQALANLAIHLLITFLF